MGCRLCLLSYLSSIALALASCAPAAAQAAKFTPSNFQLLYAAVESKGTDIKMPPHVASVLGMRVEDALPCRLVIIGGAKGTASRAVASFHYQSHQYLVLRLSSGTDHWQFLIDDAGNSAVTLHSIVRDGWQTLTPSEAQPLVAAEEAFWLKWVVDWPLP